LEGCLSGLGVVPGSNRLRTNFGTSYNWLTVSGDPVNTAARVEICAGERVCV
jgi:class 3 adenylate cyclase